MANVVSASGRKVPCEQCPLRPLPVLREFTPTELAFVSDFKAGELNIEPGATVLAEGANSPHLYTVLSGWAFRFKTLPDGRRQILNFALPSDFIGLQSAVAQEMHHSVEALTNMVLCVFPREKLWDLFTNYPSLAYDITWLAAREEQILDEYLLSVGRRTASERTAFLLMHLFTRAEQVGLTKGNAIQFPFTQQHVADTLGMSLVHTNKTLRRLAGSRAMRWKDRVFELLERDRLAEIAGFSLADGVQRPLI